MARRLTRPWLQAYLDYVNESESPRNYNLWSGIHAISASLKKKVYIQRGFFKIYPNQYIILVGPPGIGKGTAINPAVDLVKKAGTVNYISDRVTAEKIIEKLATGFSAVVNLPGGGQTIGMADKAATIVSTELPIFLQASEWMLPLMCEMWDRNEFSYETKTKSSYKATDLCVGLLGGCVPDYIRKLNRDATAAVTGGFTSRCIFVFATEKGRVVPWPNNNGNFNQLEKDLEDDLKTIGQLSGSFTFAPDARAMFEHYYMAQKSDPFESEVLISFKARMVSHIFKTAMALAVSEGDSLVINRDHLFNAIKLVEDIRDKVDLVFRSVGDSPLASAQDRIMRYMESKKYATRSQILKDNFRHVTDEQLGAVLYMLSATGFIVEETVNNRFVYRLESYTLPVKVKP